MLSLISSFMSPLIRFAHVLNKYIPNLKVKYIQCRFISSAIFNEWNDVSHLPTQHHPAGNWAPLSISWIIIVIWETFFRQHCPHFSSVDGSCTRYYDYLQTILVCKTSLQNPGVDMIWWRYVSVHERYLTGTRAGGLLFVWPEIDDDYVSKPEQ